MISYQEAYELTLEHIRPLDSETVPLLNAAGRVAGRDLHAQVDSPSVDVSLKDGYALRGADVRAATPQSPLRLRLVGSAAAGEGWQGSLQAGEAVRILSGAPLPQGADAVLSEEFTRALPGEVEVFNHVGSGRNILPQGTDIHAGQLLVPAGQRLHPTTVGLLAAAGSIEMPCLDC